MSKHITLNEALRLTKSAVREEAKQQAQWPRCPRCGKACGIVHHGVPQCPCVEKKV